MDRRQFIAGGALVAAVGAGAGALQRSAGPPKGISAVVAAPEIPMVMTPIAVGSAELSQHVGKRLLLEGWLRPSHEGPGHYFVFTETENGRADRRHVRVYPTDTAKMSTGRVQLEGRYFEGKFVDEPTGKQAAAVLIEAI